jgi:hypothetical protein
MLAKFGLLQLVEPCLKSRGAEAIVMSMASPNGLTLHCHSILGPLVGEAQLQSAVLAAVQVSLLNSVQAKQISIFTCVALAVFCLAPHRPKALYVAPALSNPLAASAKQRKALCRTASVA